MKVNHLNVTHAGIKRNPANNTSFKGIASKLGSLNQVAMSKLEKGGFFAEFVLLDLIGLVLPRVYQGFQRNKEELGHLNFQAGIEELLREAITGPSLFLIPIGILTGMGKALGKAVQINSNVMKKFTESFENVGESIAKSSDAKNQKAFAEKLFDNLYKKHPDVATAGLEAVAEKNKTNFVNILTNSLDKTGDDLKKAAGEFTETISTLNASLFPKKKNTLGVDVILGDKKFGTSAADLFEDARKYMQDVVPSVKLTIDDAIKSGKEATIDIAKDAIKKITDIRANGRRLMCISGVTALAAFLTIIPKIYQRSKTNPALAGLVKEEGKEAKAC